MQIKNSVNRYGVVSMTLHWVMAFLVIGMLIVGLYMTGLHTSLQKLKLYGWHKEVGMLILGLVILRWYWRIINVTPVLPNHIPTFQKFAARMVHVMLLLFLIAMPITGWLISSAVGLPVSFFGLFTIPTLIQPNPDIKHLLENIHEWLAYGLIAMICAHAGAALHHHFVVKDDILRRMLP